MVSRTIAARTSSLRPLVRGHVPSSRQLLARSLPHLPTRRCLSLAARPSFDSSRSRSSIRIKSPACLAYSTSATLEPALESHNEAVKRISADVRGFYEKKEKFRIHHGSTNSTRPRKHKNIVDTSGLSRVLKIDVETQTALVEPNVPMDRLVEATLKYGLVPPVVMEFPGITAGGGYAGTSGESSSFRHGFFNETLNRVEMVLADGEVVNCSATERPDLFHGAAGAVGTLGVTTLVELRLQKAKKYVETTYHPVSSMPDAIAKIEAATSDPQVDYVDGIMYSTTHGAVITGRLTDTLSPTTKTQNFSDAKDPWFYLHVQETIADKTAPVVEGIPLAEYLFRYDRGGFWVGASAFKYFGMPFNSFTRWWLDDFLHTRMMYTALHASGQSKNYIVQDLALPYETATEFVDYCDKDFGIWPLWLCPLKQSPSPTFHPNYKGFEQDGKSLKPMLNIGLWGPSRHADPVKANRELEQKLKELKGMKWLYAHTYYDEAEFWEVYDNKSWYDDLRQKYRATSLPSVHEKVLVDTRKPVEKLSLSQKFLDTWPFNGFYGIRKAIQSRHYVEARASAWKNMHVETNSKS
ncbi:putative FAD binding-containing protein [Coleophoma cylindrospora]|uniref:Delta(24)-sterol reductase n=1 Tax=Coleophoma cylindrospora TaxID=1849047 RepID=A0A3D8RAP8_9HELO|nr:putative FAD binding-containing protein [Coleophoma cylindrospora]